MKRTPAKDNPKRRETFIVAILRIPDVVTRVGLSRASIYRLISRNQFGLRPAAVHFGRLDGVEPRTGCCRKRAICAQRPFADGNARCMPDLGRLSKTWSQRLRVHGRPVNVRIGACPVVTLAEARRVALANRRTVARGRDPRSGGVPTFAEAVETVIAIHGAAWRPGSKSEAQWRASLRDYAMPRLGRERIDEITTSDVMAVLLPIWTTKAETARRVRQRIGTVMKWAVAKGYRPDNPAGGAIGAALPKSSGTRRHFRALPHSEVGTALDTVLASSAWALSKLAFEFLVLTAARSGEVRGARWEEIDFESATWTVPAERMKAARKHRVPMSSQALEVLHRAQELADGTGLVFPSPTGRVLSPSTLSKLLRELGIRAVPHGFRTSFRIWCGDTGVAREVAEAALAHVIRDKVEAAYARGTLFARRREVMEAWSRYIRGESQGGGNSRRSP